MSNNRTRRYTTRVGAAVLTTSLASMIGVTTFGGSTSAAGTVTVEPSVLVPIVPCRLVDTRASGPIGAGGVPLPAGGSVMYRVTGTNGDCTIPSTATGIASNVTIDNPTASSYLTVYPADAPRPLSSNLNWTASSSPTPNQVTVGLSESGAISVFNNSGNVDVIIDIVGYYEPAGGAASGTGSQGSAGPGGALGPKGDTGAQGPAGPAGTQGPAGPAGSQGPAGPAGAQGPAGPAGTTGPIGATGPAGDPAVHPDNVIWVATSGGDFTLVSAALASINDASATNPYVVMVGPGVFAEPVGVTAKSYVDIAGSGQGTTVITGSPTDNLTGTFNVVGSSIHTNLRDLTIEVAGAGFQGIGALLKPGANSVVSLDDVTVTARSAGHLNDAIINREYHATARVTLNNVTAVASGATQNIAMLNQFGGSPIVHGGVFSATGGSNAMGVYIESDSGPTFAGTTITATGASNNYGTIVSNNSPAVFDDVDITAGGGSFNVGVTSSDSATVIRGSSITGSIAVSTASGTVRIADTQIDGTISGSPTCLGSYNAAFVARNMTCG